MHLDQIPDGVKITGAVAAPVLQILGVTVEDWTFILSAIVSILFIIEKMPMLIARTKALIKWIKEVKRK